MQTCSYCGSENVDQAPLCSRCGSELKINNADVAEHERGNLLTNLFSFKGRIGRETFWLTMSGLAVINVLFGIALPPDGLAIFALVFPVLLAAGLATHAKRWHDRGKSGWMILINLIPLVGLLWSFVELGFFEGDIGPNKYGEDPLKVDDNGTESAGYALLSQALRFQRHGRIPEALAAYDHIAVRYRDMEPGHDAEKSAESLRAITGATK